MPSVTLTCDQCNKRQFFQSARKGVSALSAMIHGMGWTRSNMTDGLICSDQCRRQQVINEMLKDFRTPDKGDTCPMCDTCTFDIDSDATGVFEIHVTVHTDDVDRFVKVCEANWIKPMVIEFQRWLDAGTATQVMTSQRVVGTKRDLDREQRRIIAALSEFPIERVKIETAPKDAHLYDVCYFESHLAVQLRSLLDYPMLAAFCDRYGVHLSRNAFKSGVYMITCRQYETTAKDFLNFNKHLRTMLTQSYFEVTRIILEACIYDNNTDNDKDWIKQ